MLEMKCPKCRSGHVSQERRIDGDAICMDCHHRGKPKEFRRQTNFDRLAESPEKLAPHLIYWNNVAGCYSLSVGEELTDEDGDRIAGFFSRQDALDFAIEYLKREMKE